MRLRPGGAVLAPALAGMAAALLALVGVEVVLFIEGPVRPLWVVLLFPADALLYIGVGLLAWTRRPSNRMGALLVVGGFVACISGLPNTGIPALIAVGLVIATVPLAIVVHLLHAFPSGRLRGRASRLTVLAAYFVVFVLQAPVYLFGQGAEGPTTVLQIADRHDLAHLGAWVQSIAGAAVMVATAAILVGRLRRAEPAKRRVMAPLVAYGIFAVLFVPLSGIPVRTWLPGDGLELAVAQLAVVGGVSIAFVAALLSGGFARTDEGRPALRAVLRQVLATTRSICSSGSPSRRAGSIGTGPRSSFPREARSGRSPRSGSATGWSGRSSTTRP
jgi:hypothetical protein